MKTKFCLYILWLSTCFFTANGQSLKSGDTAPPLHIIKWLKGKPVKTFEKGKVYLVEFGYVNCPPCRAAIPHLTELAQKYRKDNKVEVISVFTAESNPKNPKDLSYMKRIQDLVHFMGDKMDYSIAIDEPGQMTRKDWGNIMGFPSAFIVNQEGKLATGKLGPSSPELEFALEAIVTTGKYNKEDYLKSQQKAAADAKYANWEVFEKKKAFLKSKNDYQGILQQLDSALLNASAKEKEALLFSRFETLLTLRDSTAAEQCLAQLISMKEKGWDELHPEFQVMVPPYVNHPLFNYKQYITIADRAVEESGTPFLKASQLITKANTMYAYKNNKAEAMETLNNALKIAKSSGIAKDIQRVADEISKLEQKEKRRAEADADWKQLIQTMALPTFEQQDKVQEEKGLANVYAFVARYKKKQAMMAEDFWNNYPEDKRRSNALSIFLNLNYGLVPWMAELAPEDTAALNANEKQLRLGHFKSKPQRNLYYGHAYFRTLPKDLALEAEWIRKGDEMVRHTKRFAPVEGKEELDWEVFCRDWRNASFYWGNAPTKDERPSDEINRWEKDFWKGMAGVYWEPFFNRLNEHVTKYPDLPVLADRAADFLSGTLNYGPELVAMYWQQLIDTYGNAGHPMAQKEGVLALVKRARLQLHAQNIQDQKIPVEMKFTALDGRQVDLARYRGKVVLIDFWATWCTPCLAEMPSLKATYDQYREKGFEVIGICLDKEDKREEVKALLKKIGLTAPQRFEGVGFGADQYKQLFNLVALPTVWLIDKEGMLISTNARGEELQRLLQQYL